MHRCSTQTPQSFLISSFILLSPEKARSPPLFIWFFANAWLVATTDIYIASFIAVHMIEKVKKLRNLLNQWEIHTTVPVDWARRERWIDDMLDVLDDMEKTEKERTKRAGLPSERQSASKPDDDGGASRI